MMPVTIINSRKKFMLNRDSKKYIVYILQLPVTLIIGEMTCLLILTLVLTFNALFNDICIRKIGDK